MMSGRFITTTKDIGLLRQLYSDGQLVISPEFQRNAVWTRSAKAYLIDSILSESPIPVLYFQRKISAQTGRVEYAVVDGQQRLNSVFLFMENRFSLTESSPDAPWYKKRWKELDPTFQERILSYDFVVQELTGYEPQKIREMFRRMNRYVVALNPQELRHADESGVFKEQVEIIGGWDYWEKNKIVTTQAARRMKNDELVAELLILLNEGPQDKKESVDLYYTAYKDEFPDGEHLESELKEAIDLIEQYVPNLSQSRLRRAPNFYALVGAISEIRNDDVSHLPDVSTAQERIAEFESMIDGSANDLPAYISEFQVAQSRQTDNLKPRRTRIDILKSVILGQV